MSDPGATEGTSGVPGWRMPLSRLLLATDFSRHSERAANRLALLPLAPDAEIRILHGITPENAESLTRAGEAAIRRALRVAESDTRRAVRALGYRRVEVSGELHVGTAEESLPRTCEAYGTELIVLGRHGEQTFRDQLLGSTAERIIRASTTPVLVVNGRPTRPYRAPVFGIDLREPTRRALEMGLRITPEAKAIRLVHAYEHSYELVMRRFELPKPRIRDYRARQLDAAQDEVRKYIARYEAEPARFDLLLHGGDPRRAILEVLGSDSADLVVLGTSGRRGVAHLLLGSVAETVLRRATCDVLIARTVR